MIISIVFDYCFRFWLFVFDRLILYPLLKWYAKKVGTHFLNLGYWPSSNFGENKIIKTVSRVIKDRQDKNLAHYYLYEKTLSLHHAYPSFPGYSIVEVGCGQGEGMKWINRAHPLIASIEGIDPMPQIDSLVRKGNAENIPAESKSCDIILNIESSHLYKDCFKFFSECNRALKPGGYVCWADLRYKQQVQEVKDQATRAGFIQEAWVDITENVLNGIPKTAENYDSVIDQAPSIIKLFKSTLRSTYCAPGTKTHSKIANGIKGYYCALWKKAD